ncbi:hypothetical protein ACLOJK_021424 [Asimina triloba]
MESRKWEELGMDCLVQVFGRVGVEELSLSVPLVCRSWYMASLSPLCWTTLNLEAMDFNTMSSRAFAESFKSEYRLKCFSFTGFLKLLIYRSSTLLVHLILHPHTRISSHDLLYMSLQCPLLKVLVLPPLREEEEELLPKLIHKWKHLEWLSTRFLSSSFREIATQVGLHCNNFTGLQTVGWILNNEASTIVTCLGNIKYLNLSGSFLSRTNLLMILDCCKQLEELHVDFCAGFTVDSEVLKRGGHLKTFDYTGSSVDYT